MLSYNISFFSIYLSFIISMRLKKVFSKAIESFFSMHYVHYTSNSGIT